MSDKLHPAAIRAAENVMTKRLPNGAVLVDLSRVEEIIHAAIEDHLQSERDREFAQPHHSHGEAEDAVRARDAEWSGDAIFPAKQKFIMQIVKTRLKSEGWEELRVACTELMKAPGASQSYAIAVMEIDHALRRVRGSDE